MTTETTPTFTHITKRKIIATIAHEKGSIGLATLNKLTTIPENIFVLWEILTGSPVNKFSDNTLLFWAHVPETSDHMNKVVDNVIVFYFREMWSSITYENRVSIDEKYKVYATNANAENLKELFSTMNNMENNGFRKNFIKHNRKSIFLQSLKYDYFPYTEQNPQEFLETTSFKPLDNPFQERADTVNRLVDEAFQEDPDTK